MTEPNSDGLSIPDFLHRHYSPEDAAKLKRITARHHERRIKSPPKRARRTGLGAAFGAKIRST